jgi:hypothetical protein
VKVTKNEREEANMNCLRFQKQEDAIGGIIAGINQAGDIAGKAELASTLQQEVEVLLSCRDYDHNSDDCTSCHFHAHVRKRVAGLFIRARKLG